MKNWYYSVFLLVAYLVTFHLWMLYPSRTFFVASGLISTAVAGMALVWSARRGYFTDRNDLLFHLLVVMDLLVEGFIYEIHKTLALLGVLTEKPDHYFHYNYSFYYCAIAFALLIGLRRRKQLGLAGL